MQTIKDFWRPKIEKLSRFFETDMMYVFKSGFWMNANFIINSFLGLLSSILFAHFVSKETYGTYQFILAIASSIAVFVPNNMSSAVLRSVARGNEGDFIKATKFQIRWGIVGSLISLGVSVWYAINQNLGLSLSLLIIALFMPTTFALNTWSAYVQGKKDYKRYFLYNTLGSFISYGGVITMLFIKRDFFWLAFANIFFAFLTNLILYKITCKSMRPNTQTDPETIQYGTHLSIMGIPQGLSGHLDTLLIFHYLGAAPLAVYSFATLFPERLAGGFKFLSAIIFPKFSEKSEEQVKGFFKKKFWWLMVFLAIIVISYALIAPFIFKIFFPKYLESIPYTQVYALSFFVIAASIPQAALISQKKTKSLYISQISVPVLKAILLFLMLKTFGIWGIIWAQLITIFFQIFLPFYLLNKKKF